MNTFRLLCALLVLVSHLRIFPNTGLENEIFSVGAVGVDFFFILSGFSMAGMVEKYREKKNFPFIFLANRLVRVGLPYIFATLIFIKISVNKFDFEEIYKSILFLNNYNREYNIFGLPILPPGWSVNYEMIFYVSIAFSAIVKKYYFPLIPLFILVFSNIFVPISYIWLEIIAGYYIFYSIEKTNLIVSSNKFIFFIVCLISFILIFQNRNIAGDFVSVGRFLYWGLPSIVIFIGICFLIKSIKLIGFFEKFNISYSIYLTHWIVLTFNTQSNNRATYLLYLELFISSIIYYFFIELPSHKFSKKIFLHK